MAIQRISKQTLLCNSIVFEDFEKLPKFKEDTIELLEQALQEALYPLTSVIAVAGMDGSGWRDIVAVCVDAARERFRACLNGGFDEEVES